MPRDDRDREPLTAAIDALREELERHRELQTMSGPEVGQVFDLRVMQDVMVGPKQLTPNANAEHEGREGWLVQVDEVRNCVWLGNVHHAGFWTRLPWDAIRAVRYCTPEGRRPGEDEASFRKRIGGTES